MPKPTSHRVVLVRLEKLLTIMLVMEAIEVGSVHPLRWMLANALHYCISLSDDELEGIHFREQEQAICLLDCLSPHLCACATLLCSARHLQGCGEGSYGLLRDRSAPSCPSFISRDSPSQSRTLATVDPRCVHDPSPRNYSL